MDDRDRLTARRWVAAYCTAAAWAGVALAWAGAVAWPRAAFAAAWLGVLAAALWPGGYERWRAAGGGRGDRR